MDISRAVAALALLTASVEAAPPAPPTLLNMEDAAKATRAAQNAALSKVKLSSAVVTRQFYTGPADIHGGYVLYEQKTYKDELERFMNMISPDFYDEETAWKFGSFFQKADETWIGKRVLCECQGVDWTFRGEHRFLIKAAKLSLVD